MRHRILVTEIFEQGCQSGEFASDGGAAKGLLFQIGALGQHMGPGDLAELCGVVDTGKTDESGEVILVGAAGLHIVDVGKSVSLL